jgi:hypothetical protein
MWKLRERLKKQEEEKQNRPIDPLLPFGLRRGMPGQMFKFQGSARNTCHFFLQHYQTFLQNPGQIKHKRPKRQGKTNINN